MTPARAKEIIRLTQWQNGGCGNYGNPRPDVAEETADERKMLSAILSTMDGRYNTMTVLHEIANGRILVTAARKAT